MAEESKAEQPAAAAAVTTDAEFRGASGLLGREDEGRWADVEDAEVCVLTTTRCGHHEGEYVEPQAYPGTLCFKFDNQFSWTKPKKVVLRWETSNGVDGVRSKVATATKASVATGLALGVVGYYTAANTNKVKEEDGKVDIDVAARYEAAPIELQCAPGTRVKWTIDVDGADAGMDVDVSIVYKLNLKECLLQHDAAIQALRIAQQQAEESGIGDLTALRAQLETLQFDYAKLEARLAATQSQLEEATADSQSRAAQLEEKEKAIVAQEHQHKQALRDLRDAHAAAAEKAAAEAAAAARQAERDEVLKLEAQAREDLETSRDAAEAERLAELQRMHAETMQVHRAELEAAHAAHVAAIESKEGEIAEAREALEAQSDGIACLEAKAEEAKAAAEEAKAAAAELESQMSSKDKTNEQLKQMVDALQQRIAALAQQTTELEQVTQEKAVLEATNAQQTAELEQVTQEKAVLEATNAQLRTQITEMEKEAAARAQAAPAPVFANDVVLVDPVAVAAGNLWKCHVCQYEDNTADGKFCGMCGMAKPPKEEKVAKAKAGARTLLWVDNHPENNKTLLDLAKTAGVDVHTVTSSRAAMDWLQKNVLTVDAAMSATFDSQHFRIITNQVRTNDCSGHKGDKGEHAGTDLCSLLRAAAVEVPVLVFTNKRWVKPAQAQIRLLKLCNVQATYDEKVAWDFALFNGPWQAVAAPAPVDWRSTLTAAEKKYEPQLAQLWDMGFCDVPKMVTLLKRHKGNVQSAILEATK